MSWTSNSPDKGYTKADPESIQTMFSRIAKRYDRGNAVLSMQMHRLWNRKLVKSIVMPAKPKVLLDLCAGTGDIAFDYLSRCSDRRSAVLLDFCGDMLECAKEKARAAGYDKRHDITYVEGDAQAIPLPESSVDAVTIAYGIRNVRSPQQCFSEVQRVLRPNGVIGILELTQPDNPVLKVGHSLYLNTVVPVLGRLVATDGNAYRYLRNSIKAFTPPKKLANELIKAGLRDVRCIPLLGGTATIITGRK